MKNIYEMEQQFRRIYIYIYTTVYGSFYIFLYSN